MCRRAFRPAHAPTPRESEPVRITNILVIGLLLAAIGLSACGRRGPVEAPPGAGSNDDKPTVLDPLIQ